MIWPVALAFHRGVVRLVRSSAGRVPSGTVALKMVAHSSSGPSNCSVRKPPLVEASGRAVVALKNMTPGTGRCGCISAQTKAAEWRLQPCCALAEFTKRQHTDRAW